MMVLVRQAERPYTAEDLLGMPEDGKCYEVIGGELVVSPSPTERHQRVLMELLFHFQQFVREAGLGAVYAAPLDVQLGLYDVVQPDLVVVLKEHRDRIQSDGIHGAPDIVVEVISPGSRGTDRVRKSAVYAEAGVKEYWLVDPDAQSIVVQALSNGLYEDVPFKDGCVRSTVLAGFELVIQDIFAVPDWMMEAGS
jgi:Uma2 family endonuclease